MGERTDRQRDGIHPAPTKEALHCCVSRESEPSPEGAPLHKQPQPPEKARDAWGHERPKRDRRRQNRGEKGWKSHSGARRRRAAGDGSPEQGGLSLRATKQHRHPFSSLPTRLGRGPGARSAGRGSDPHTPALGSSQQPRAQLRLVAAPWGIPAPHQPLPRPGQSISAREQ